MTESYRVQLDVFTGPLDLLLYLVRQDELDIQDISITRVTDQYVEHIKLLEALDPNTAGEFLVMATTLVELKSRALLPSPPLEGGDEDDDPRTVLVKQLLEYKRFKDAARALKSSSDERAKRYVRKPVDLPRELQGVELEEAEECCGFGGGFAVWDPEISTELGRRKARHLDATGAQVVAVGDVGCMTHINGILVRGGHRCRAVHIAELLAGDDEVRA